MLGETFEYIDRRTNTRGVAEQVSHHPPVSALHIENENWQFKQSTSPSTKFLGNSLDLTTHGQSYVYFPKTKDHFYYTNPCTRVHNIILGSMWLEHFGHVSIKNLKNGETCVINFKKSGMFQGTQYKVEGYVYDSKGTQCVKLEGTWDQYVDGTWLVDTAGVKKGQTKRLWKILDDNFLGEPYHFTHFAGSLNECEDEDLVPATDSRRRLDRLFLERGDIDNATHWKRVMEDRQRQDKKKRGNQVFKPNYFKEVEMNLSTDATSELKKVWVYAGGYWEQREKNSVALRDATVENQETNGFCTSSVRGTACDFFSYGITPNLSDPTNTTTTSTDAENVTSSDEVEEGDLESGEDTSTDV